MSALSLPPIRKMLQCRETVAEQEGRRHSPVASLLLAALALLTLIACGQTGASPEAPPIAVAQADLSDTAREGEARFTANCAQCHGPGAVGTSQGPTFIDRIYHPGHHADVSFRLAVRQGVRQHHWQFGNMLPVPGLADAEVDTIICYVRELQLASGVFRASEYQPIC